MIACTLKKLHQVVTSAVIFATFFMAAGTALALALFGTDFWQKLLGTNSDLEKGRMVIAFYISVILIAGSLFLLSSNFKTLSSKMRLLSIGGLCGVLTLPFSSLIAFLLSGAPLDMEAIAIVLVLPFLFSFFMPLALTLCTGMLSGLLFYAYQKRIHPQPNGSAKLTTGETVPGDAAL